MKKTAMTLAALLLPFSYAHADDCMDKANTQAEMNVCAKGSYEEADAKLNRDYRMIHQRLSDDAKAQELLRASERAWVAFRDAECAFAASATEGGSAYGMVYDECLADLTDERRDRLENYLDCEEGDLSCPVPPAN